MRCADLWLKEEERSLEKPIYDETAKPSVADVAAMKKLCEELHINLKAWVAREGKTVEQLTGIEVGHILRTLNEEKEKRAKA